MLGDQRMAKSLMMSVEPLLVFYGVRLIDWDPGSATAFAASIAEEYLNNGNIQAHMRLRSDWYCGRPYSVAATQDQHQSKSAARHDRPGE
jgi:hypothetical protein